VNSLQSRPLFEISIDLHPIQEIGSTPAGHRRVIPVSGGRFNGERLNGTVLPHSGSDLLLMRADGSFQQDVRLVLRSDDGALILMTYRGVRHSPPEVSRRIAAAKRSRAPTTICASHRSSRPPRQPMDGSTGS
jgi:hypothetical protein